MNSALLVSLTHSLHDPIEQLILNQSVNVLVETRKIPSVFVRRAQVKNKNRPATEAGRNMYIALNDIRNGAFSVLPFTRV
jgi:hypothetical protein